MCGYGKESTLPMLQVAGMVSVIWMSGLYLTAFAPWLHIPVYVGPLVMYATMLTAVFLPLPILYHRSRLWFLSKMVSGKKYLSIHVIMSEI